MLNRVKSLLERALDKLVGDRTPLSPNAITLLSLVFSAATLLASYLSLPLLFTAFVLLLSALLDALDGYVARKKGRTTKFGAFLDSTIDRVSDALHTYALYLCGVLEPYLAYAMLASEYLVSYTRARAESLGANFSGVGLMERGERVLAKAAVIALQSANPYASRALAYVLILLTAVTAVQRVRAAADMLK